MSDSDCLESNKELEIKIERIVSSLEKRLRANPPSMPPLKVQGWRSAAVILGVLTAVTTPVLAVTWYASDNLNQLSSVSSDVDEMKSEIGSMKREMQRLRETLILYTKQPLPIPHIDSAMGHGIRNPMPDDDYQP